MVFLTKERPILTALKQMILDEIKQSNGIKPQKIYFFMIFCKFLPHKGNFCWKVPSKVIYTFYLKHRKYPFCAPIFHPLSETESYVPRCRHIRFHHPPSVDWLERKVKIYPISCLKPWNRHYHLIQLLWIETIANWFLIQFILEQIKKMK